jgi:hypothetical protein
LYSRKNNNDKNTRETEIETVIIMTDSNEKCLFGKLFITSFNEGDESDEDEDVVEGE